MQPPTITAWTPAVEGIREVLHGRFGEHAYPMHSHDSWTVLVMDAGAVRYDLGRTEHGATPDHVTLLPPDVPHDGRAARSEGFRKRVIYLERDMLGDESIGAAVASPELRDPLLRARIDRLHVSLREPGHELEAASRLALIVERLGAHLNSRPERPDVPNVRRDRQLASRLRELIDESIVEGVSLRTASELLGAAPAQLVRGFSRTFGMPPHRYLVGRRIDLARRELLSGLGPADAAVAAGFYDQSHLDRHFRRMFGTTAARFVA